MPDRTITVALKDLTEVAFAVNAFRDHTRRHVGARKAILLYTDTSHTGALENAIRGRDRAEKKAAAAADILIEFGIDLHPLVADIDQTLPAQIECTCGWCTGEWK